MELLALEELLRSVQQGEWTLVLDKTRTGRTQLLEVSVPVMMLKVIRSVRSLPPKGVIADPMVHSSVFQDRDRVVFVDGLIDGFSPN